MKIDIKQITEGEESINIRYREPNPTVGRIIGILRGDDTAVYWSSLAIKFNDVQRQQLRLEAQKVPKKVKRLSMCLLICFMLIYVVVILEQIVTSMGILFQ